jgi:hypothetical protein
MAHGAHARVRSVLPDDPTSFDEDPEMRRARLDRRRQELGRTSPFREAVRRDHARLTTELDRVRAADPGPDRDVLWEDLFAGLTAHTHVEREVLHAHLAGDERARELLERLADRHGLVVDLLLGVDGTDAGDPQLETRLEDLRQAFADHVRDDEQELLGLADRVLEPLELETLERRFSQRRLEVEREIAALRGHRGSSPWRE